MEGLDNISDDINDERDNECHDGCEFCGCPGAHSDISEKSEHCYLTTFLTVCKIYTFILGPFLMNSF